MSGAHCQGADIGRARPEADEDTLTTDAPHSYNRLTTGIGLSILLHLLAVTLVFSVLQPVTQPRQRQYTVRLVEPPAISPATPSITGAMPEVPSELTVPQPSAPATVPVRPPELMDTPTSDPTETPQPELGPRAIYDKAEIATTAMQSARQEGLSDDGVTFDTTDIVRRGYMDMLKQKVESIWDYPVQAARQGIYGDLVIRFVIRRDGTLGEVKVLKTSGHRLLDDAAVKALRSGVPYWPLPDGWNQESLVIRGRFIYTQGKYYLR